MRAASRRPSSSYSANKISSWHIPLLVLVGVFSPARRPVRHYSYQTCFIDSGRQRSAAQNFHRLHFSHEKGLGRPEGKKTDNKSCTLSDHQGKQIVIRQRNRRETGDASVRFAKITSKYLLVIFAKRTEASPVSRRFLCRMTICLP